jgi:hypothetical protein
MEAPPPPPGMSYNAYRSWRKESGIAGTRKELTDAWRAYSSGRASPRPSPERASPKRSPVRYGGLASASLLGLPRDVSRMITSRLDKAATVSMRTASTGTSKLAEEELLRLCKAPVTVDELLRVIRTLELPVAYSVAERVAATGEIVDAERLLVVSDEQMVAMREKYAYDTEGVVGLDDAVEDLEQVRDRQGKAHDDGGRQAAARERRAHHCKERAEGPW